MLMIFSIIALLGALIGLGRTSKDRKIGRQTFWLISLIAWAPLLALLFIDLMRLVAPVSGVVFQVESTWFALWFSLTAYPLFAGVAWRLNDAGKGRFWGYMALIPYLNFFVFIYLCLLSSENNEITAE